MLADLEMELLVARQGVRHRYWQLIWGQNSKRGTQIGLTMFGWELRCHWCGWIAFWSVADRISNGLLDILLLKGSAMLDSLLIHGSRDQQRPYSLLGTSKKRLLPYLRQGWENFILNPSQRLLIRWSIKLNLHLIVSKKKWTKVS
jgi:hypothetical protein